MKRIIISLLVLLILKDAVAQNADPAINIGMAPAMVQQNAANAGTLTVQLSNLAPDNSDIPVNNLEATISFPSIVSVGTIDLSATGGSNWTVFSIVGTTVKLRNTGGVLLGNGGLGQDDFVYIHVTGITIGGPSNITANITYRPGLLPLPGNLAPGNDNSQTSIIVTAPLPLKLVGFTAQEKDCAAALSWNTTGEINTSYFEIQQSYNAVDYTKVAKVNAQGNGNGKAYSALVNQSSATQVYYRLKMVDKDGSFTYSHIVAIKINCSGRKDYMIIYPNPVNTGDAATLSFSTAYRGKASVQITNAIGQKLSTTTINITNDGNLFSIETARLTNGFYYVEVKNDKGALIGQVQKFIKQ